MTIFEIQILWFTLAPSYYGLMYAIWFLAWYYIILKRNFLSRENLDNLFVYIFLWVILWWRLGYILFYNFNSYLNEPLNILKVWEWWMSFHWWVIWVILAMFLFSRKYKVDFLKLADQVTLVLPIWLWLWRIWNYLNWELLGYSWYNWFLAYYKNWIWYFPSTLLEAFLEWLIIFIILNYLYYINRNYTCNITNCRKEFLFKWQIASLFLILYWLFRIIVELFFRTPDSHIWYIVPYISMWTLLSLPMLLVWIILFLKFKNDKKS